MLKRSLVSPWSSQTTSAPDLKIGTDVTHVAPRVATWTDGAPLILQSKLACIPASSAAELARLRSGARGRVSVSSFSLMDFRFAIFSMKDGWRPLIRFAINLPQARSNLSLVSSQCCLKGYVCGVVICEFRASGFSIPGQQFCVRTTAAAG